MNASQIQEFSNDLDKIAVAIGTLRQNGKLGTGQVISSPEKDDLLISQIKILRASARFSAQMIVLSGSQIKGQLDELRSAAAVMDKTLSKIKTVQDVISLSALTVNVATEVVKGDITGLAGSLEKLLTSIHSIDKSSDKSPA